MKAKITLERACADAFTTNDDEALDGIANDLKENIEDNQFIAIPRDMLIFLLRRGAQVIRLRRIVTHTSGELLRGSPLPRNLN